MDLRILSATWGPATRAAEQTRLWYEMAFCPSLTWEWESCVCVCLELWMFYLEIDSPTQRPTVRSPESLQRKKMWKFQVYKENVVRKSND